MLDLTIAIPVKNEERNIKGCLECIGEQFVKKIVLIDSGSTDATLEIARSYGAEIIDFKWNGKYPKKRNWYLENHQPDTKWVLFLDADEYLTPAFKNSLRHAISSDDKEGFWLNYTIYFQNKILKGGYPLKKLALFRVGNIRYEKIDEESWSGLDMEIHEHPIVSGKTGQIKARIDHQDFRGIDHYIKKHDEYGTWEARRFLRLRNNNAIWNDLTWKQKMKYRLMNTPYLGPMFFIGSFFFMGGFRDGRRGFTFSLMKMSYFTQIYCKIREYKKN
ncbi:MAG: glycosyltransferase family 2 protein [Citrobacter freundii]|nr:MAG: glycosyltransferase family 2 protein [Citrobacter freundii]